MAMFERSLFNKPIAVTHKHMVSGVQSLLSTMTSFLNVPWNKLGYLKRIEIGRGCNGASGCFQFEIWDDFYDPLTEVSGLIARKVITVPDSVAQINWDESEDIPLIGTIYGVPSISGVDVTIAIRTM